MKIKNSVQGLDLKTLSAGIILAASLRMAMAPYPNIEPVMLFTIAAALSAGPLYGFLLGAGSMIASNVFMAPGALTFPWILHMPLVTIYTSMAYGLVGLVAGLLGRYKRKWGRVGMASLALPLTVFYDLVTCLCFALQFYGPGGVPAALVAQIPFTALHLSNVVLALLFGPFLVGAFSRFRQHSVAESLKKWLIHT